jgi:hypothetical protein
VGSFGLGPWTVLWRGPLEGTPRGVPGSVPLEGSAGGVLDDSPGGVHWR